MSTFSLIKQQVAESAARNGISGKVLIGLSGGADSVALLCALCEIRTEIGVTPMAIYVNHGLRTEAEEEEAFCAALCGRLRVPFSVRCVSVSAKGSLEASARDARYRAFQDEMNETGCGTLVLAHHMDDQAETLLLHLCYGAGSDGLAGMSEYRTPTWRPLLGLRRETLRSALREIGQEWREDQSNANPEYTRNYLRLRVMPMLEALYPEAVSAMARTSIILQGENDYLQKSCLAWLEQNTSKGPWPFIMVAPLRDMHIAMRRRILRMYAARFGLSLEFSHTEALVNLAESESGAACNLPMGWQGLKTRDRIHLIAPKQNNRKMQWDPDLLRLCVSSEKVNGRQAHAIPAGLYEKAKLRTRLPGDWIRSFGMHGTMKLKDYMISRNVDRPFRADWPLLCEGSEVLWVIGIGASERLRVDPQAKDHFILSFSGDLPDAL